MSNENENKKLTLGSLFDGIAGFPYAAERFGIETKWTSEIEPAPSEISVRHFPNAKQLGDVTKINGAEIEPVDIISFGSPCTDLSIAGKREGLKGSRSGLYVEAVRIIKEMLGVTNGEYPRYCVFENVPGLLSSNKGNDFITCLDMMQDMGYIPDPNILDAQYTGVPQRRKRVYITWLNVDYILRKRTIISDSIILQLLTELLQINLAELLKAFVDVPKKSAVNAANLSEDGLKKRIKLFSLQKEDHLERLQNNLKEIKAIYLSRHTNSGLYLGEDQTEDIISTKEDITYLNSTTAHQFMYIDKLWKTVLDESSQIMNASIISTWTNETTNSKICFYFQALLDMLDVTICLIRSYPKEAMWQNYYEWVKYILIEMRDFINAGKKYEKSIDKLGGNDDLRVFEQRLEKCVEQVERYFGT